MKKAAVIANGVFNPIQFNNQLIHDSPYFKIINFNFEPGQALPVHSHDIEGQVSILVLEGEGEFLSTGDPVPAKAGDMLICDIAEPHGIKATSRLRALVTIAPPI